MKKLFHYLLLGGLLLASCQSQSVSKRIIITGELPQDAEEAQGYIYLVNADAMSAYGDGAEQAYDSTALQGRSFRFELDKPDSIDYAMVYLKDRYSLPLFLEPGTIHIDFDKSWASGTALNDSMLAYNEEIEAESKVSRERFNTYHQELEALPETSPEVDSIDRLISAEVYDLMTRHSAISERLLAQHPDDAMGVRLMLELLALDSSDLSEVARWKALAGPYVLAHPLVAQYITKYEAKRKTQAGQMFIDFEGDTATAGKIKLSQYVGQGHYTLIDFWASWCAPCRAELPKLKKIYEQYKGQGLEIVGVAISDSVEDHIKAVKAEGVTWPQIISQREAATLYAVTSIPQLILCDPTGRIVARDLRSEQAEELLRAELAKK